MWVYPPGLRTFQHSWASVCASPIPPLISSTDCSVPLSNTCRHPAFVSPNAKQPRVGMSHRIESVLPKLRCQPQRIALQIVQVRPLLLHV